MKTGAFSLMLLANIHHFPDRQFPAVPRGFAVMLFNSRCGPIYMLLEKPLSIHLFPTFDFINPLFSHVVKDTMLGLIMAPSTEEFQLLVTLL